MILLTGFEPFAGEHVNPSWEAARSAAAALTASGEPAVAVLLPCVFGRSLEVLAEALDAHRPDLVLSVGQAGGRSGISLERVAINVDDARIADNAGNQPIDEPIRADGPAAYFSTLPLKRCLQVLRDSGLPAAVSQTAGTYVCNHVFYGLMDRLAVSPFAARGGFIHVPYTTEQAQVHGVPGMRVEDMASALVGIARVAIGAQDDLRLSAGAEH